LEHELEKQLKRCDIFCSVVDNFGDIGICWRLARQLVAEQQLATTLWVDDLSSFQRICPEVIPTESTQIIAGVLVRSWPAQLPPLRKDELPDLLIEALACTVPAEYVQQLAQQRPDAVWLNLEYLSAESWIEGCHGLASPQANVSLAKYFFFPGFNTKTGGLLREQSLVKSLADFAADPAAQQQFWQQLGIADAMRFQQKISLFCYEQAAIALFVEQLASATVPTLLLVPEGVLAQQLRALWPSLLDHPVLELGQLRLQILAFIPQPQYDFLLAACDINFVRGEDSIIRAQWAGKPFIWQIYRQQEQAHQVKLAAFLQQYLQQAPQELAALLQALHRQWDLELPLQDLWPQLLENQGKIHAYNQKWRDYLTSQQDLASNLVRFAENKFIMQRNFS
jgi:uncharacterized repeat protein (TIGR03837 family)